MNKKMKKRAMAMGMAAVMAVASNGMPAEAATNLKKVTVTSKIKLGVGGKKTITVKKAPKKAKVTYVSKNKKVATVS